MSPRVRNRIGWWDRLAALQGTAVELDVSRYDAALDRITRFEHDLRPLTDAALDARVQAIRDATRHHLAGQPLGAPSRPSVREPFFAITREIARRELGMRPFDVQLIAALALDDGKVIEMLTGEGKTLAAVLPGALNALTARGVHILTFNDYLARRDAEWMAPVYRRLGLTVGFVHQGMPAEERRRAYHADITYVTATEAGFDHLRDLLARDAADLVHRPFHLAIVDEADSLLIDEARIPLVIAGNVECGHSSAARLARLVACFIPGLDFDLDEYRRNVELTEAGIERAESALGCGNLHEERNYSLLTELNCALHARVLLKRDVDYLVRDGRICLIDELTGRVVGDRHWPDGIQAALEAKEGLERRPDGRILGSITLQHFLRGYPRLCGMTGTARSAANELRDVYGLAVMVIPTNRATIRVDHADQVFTHRQAKETAVVDAVARSYESGRPVLVGTASVEESERLAARLESAGVPCRVLNARNDAEEAEIVAAAGAPGAVTISTNMAGRGTDIRLGGPDEAQRERVIALGGLYVIGTNRHESRRIDDQLRGRAGRQGDPGESRFFVSLEDDLLVRYGIHGLLAGRFFSEPRMEPIDHPVVLHEIGRAQRIAEAQNFEIRKTLWRYSSAVERQRQILMNRRQKVLTGDQGPDIWKQSPRRAALVASAGEEAVTRAERAVTLHCIDSAWRDHLSLIADLRESIHLVALGGQDPLARFTQEITTAFHRLDVAIEEAVLETVQEVCIGPEGIDIASIDIRGPSATWTYLVNDDPFRNQIGTLLTGPGRGTFAVGAALAAMPLMILWGLVDRWRTKRTNTIARPGKRYR